MNQGFPDVRSLLVLVLVVTSLAVALEGLLPLALLLVFTLALLLATGIFWTILAKRLWRYRWLFLLLAVAQSLSRPSGQVYLAFRGFTLLSAGGLQAALGAMLRIGIILGAGLLLTLKDYQQVVTGLAQLGVPYELAFMVLLAVRFIPALTEEFRSSLKAIELRGVDLKTVPLRDKVRIYSYILMPTTAGALIRSRRIAIAMEARAFRAYPRRTWLEWPVLIGWDWLIILLALAGGGFVFRLKLKGVIAWGHFSFCSLFI